MKQLVLLVFLTFFVQCFKAQKIALKKDENNNKNTQKIVTGQLKAHAGQKITLTGFNYYKTLELANSIIDSLGNFALSYPKDYRGMGILKTQENSNLVFALTESNINIRGNHLKETNSISFTNSLENTNFKTYAKRQAFYKNALSAWNYLDKLYQKEQLFAEHKKIKKAIKQEKAYIHKKNVDFLANLEDDSYIKWFIPYRKLIQEMPSIVRKETERIPEAIEKFRKTDFNNANFKTSGLFKEFIEGHYMLLENMGQSLDSINVQMNISTDLLINSYKQNDSLLNTVSENLFKYFEKRSLFPAAAHLSNKLLTDNTCALNNSLANTMQRYVTLRVGNIAPDIKLGNKNLSDIKKPVLLVFGASHCPHCKDEAIELLTYYDT